jgi:hypothetical protein
MYLYTEANENVQAYALASHRHTPEIEQELSGLAGTAVVVSFTPHLVPLNRGLFTTASVPLARPASTADLIALYREFYAGEPFVGCSRGSGRPRAVVGSNFCDVTIVSDPGRPAPSASPPSTTRQGRIGERLQSLNIAVGWDERTDLAAPSIRRAQDPSARGDPPSPAFCLAWRSTARWQEGLGLITRPRPREPWQCSQNQVKGAPVLVPGARRIARAQAIVASSGCSNVCR